jgi:cell division septal protein FtsQ
MKTWDWSLRKGENNMDINFSKTLVAQYPNGITAFNLPKFDKLQKEVESLKQQIKIIKQRKKKRRWQKHGRL